MIYPEEVHFVTWAIDSIKPESVYTVGETYESLNWLSVDQTKPTKAEWDTALADVQEQWTAQEYARNRQAEYPSVADLVVALYDTDDKSAVEAKRAAVKAKYPKP
jgi:hypothetical protein